MSRSMCDINEQMTYENLESDGSQPPVFFYQITLRLLW